MSARAGNGYGARCGSCMRRPCSVRCMLWTQCSSSALNMRLSYAAGMEEGAGESLLSGSPPDPAEPALPRWQEHLPPASRTFLGLLAAVLAGTFGGVILGLSLTSIQPACICLALQPPAGCTSGQLSIPCSQKRPASWQACAGNRWRASISSRPQARHPKQGACLPLLKPTNHVPTGPAQLPLPCRPHPGTHGGGPKGGARRAVCSVHGAGGAAGSPPAHSLPDPHQRQRFLCTGETMLGHTPDQRTAS